MLPSVVVHRRPFGEEGQVAIHHSQTAKLTIEVNGGEMTSFSLIDVELRLTPITQPVEQGGIVVDQIYVGQTFDLRGRCMPYQPLDMLPARLKAAKERVKELERENDDLSLIIHDRREDHATWIEHGAKMALRRVADEADRLYSLPEGDGQPWATALRGLVESCGPILPSLRVDQLAAESARLRKALEKVAAEAESWSEYGACRAILALAREALAGG